MIIKHAGSNLITIPKREHFFEFFVQARNCINKLKETKSILEDAAEGDIDCFEELDALESQRIEDYSGLSIFVKNAVTTNNSVFVCARDVVNHINLYNEKITEFTGYGITLEGEDRKLLSERVHKIISELLYMLWFEFNAEEQLEQLEAGNDYIDEIVKMYCDTFSLNQKNVLLTLKKEREEFPFHLSIFDDYPEYESDFEAVMGPSLGSLADKEITIMQVKAVINGSITPEELVDTLSDPTNASDSSDDVKTLNSF